MNKRNLEKSINGNNGYHPVFIVMIILLVHMLLFFKNHDLILHQITLRDFDGYWHLIRVNDLYKFGNLSETILSRSNAPYGETIHWTSAFDLLLYSGAYLGSFFVDFNTALLWWSIIVNPLLHVLTFLVLFWILRDFFGDLRASIFGVIFPFQVYLSGIFDMGVPDHHGYQIFLFSLLFATSIKSIMTENWKEFSICGIVGGISIWLSIESLSTILIVISFFGIMWIFDDKIYESKNILFSFMLFLTTGFTLFFDTKPPELMRAVYDRVSIVHLFLFFITTSFWALVALMSRFSNLMEKRKFRIIVAIIGAIVCILILDEVFPDFFKNPLSNVDSTLRLIYLNQTDEFTGLFSGGHSTIEYIFWAMRILAVPIGIYLIFRKHDKEKKIWIFITAINIFYILMSALISRTIPYSTLAAIIPISYGISYFFILINDKINHSYYRIVRTAFIMFCCSSFLVPTIFFNPKQPDYLLFNKQFLAKICQYLNDDPFFREKPRRILTSIYLGPLILYKTKHEVIGTPSHRNVSGILDTYHVMNATKDSDAHAIIKKRGIKVILIGRPDYGISDYFITNNKNFIKERSRIFYFQLWKGNVPLWLQKYPVPKSLDGKIKIFKVIE